MFIPQMRNKEMTMSERIIDGKSYIEIRKINKSSKGVLESLID